MVSLIIFSLVFVRFPFSVLFFLVFVLFFKGSMQIGMPHELVGGMPGSTLGGRYISQAWYSVKRQHKYIYVVHSGLSILSEKVLKFQNIFCTANRTYFYFRVSTFSDSS